MKITTPQEKEADLSLLESAIEKFEQELSRKELGEKFYLLLVQTEYNKNVREEIEKLYKQAGWSARCTKGFENFTTELRLWRRPSKKFNIF